VGRGVAEGLPGAGEVDTKGVGARERDQRDEP